MFVIAGIRAYRRALELHINAGRHKDSGDAYCEVSVLMCLMCVMILLQVAQLLATDQKLSDSSRMYEDAAESYRQHGNCDTYDI